MFVAAMVKIVPVEEGANTTASSDGKVWRKKYQSMPDATSEQ